MTPAISKTRPLPKVRKIPLPPAFTSWIDRVAGKIKVPAGASSSPLLAPLAALSWITLAAAPKALSALGATRPVLITTVPVKVPVFARVKFVPSLFPVALVLPSTLNVMFPADPVIALVKLKEVPTPAENVRLAELLIAILLLLLLAALPDSTSVPPLTVVPPL